MITLKLDRTPTEYESTLLVKHIADALDAGESSLYKKEPSWSPLIIEHHFVEIKK